MSIKTARELANLTYPTPEFKKFWWDKVSVPSARIDRSYKPIPKIQRVHDHPARIRQLAGAARLGKSLFIAMEAVPWTFHSNLIWLLGPDYSQTRMEFLYIVEALVSIGATSSGMISMPQTKAQPCSLETEWGCTIETLTTQDPEKIASKAPDMIFMCEPGQIQDGILERTIERLTTRRGALVLAGTFEENSYSWFSDTWFKWRKWPNEDDARSFSVPMWDNIYTFPTGRNDPEIKRMEHALPRDQFLRRVCGIPTPSRHLILGDIWQPQNSKGEPYHVGWFPFVRKDGAMLKPVELFIDPGWGNDSYYYVGAMQSEIDPDTGVEIYHVVDEIAVQYHTHKQVAQLAMNKVWWPNVMNMTVEPWGGDNHTMGNQSAMEAWAEETKLYNVMAAPRLPLDERITFLRDTLKDPLHNIPRLKFNDAATPRIQWEMAHWRRSNVKTNATKPSRPSDLHCDGIKALASYLTNKNKLPYYGRPIVHDVKSGWYA